MALSELNNICYNKNFITQVIFRVDFSEILKLEENQPVEFQEKIRENFPSLETKDIVQIVTGIDREKDIYNKKITKTYFFKSKDKLQQIEINSSYFVIVYTKYSLFEELYKNINNSFRLFREIYSPLDIKRVGLRYINEIKILEGNPLEWKSYINEKLVSNLDDFANIKNNLNRTMTQMIYKFDYYSLLFNYGIFNQEFPNIISRKEFILDYDCFSTNIENEDFTNLINTFHNEIQSIFESSITSDLRKIMGVKNE